MRGPQPEDSSLPRPRVDPLSGGALNWSDCIAPVRLNRLACPTREAAIFQGLPLLDAVSCDGVEWRDEKFQRVDAVLA